MEATVTGLESKPKQVTITLTRYKDHTKVVQYRTTLEDAELTAIYVGKHFSNPMPKAIRVTIEAA
jgi:hypothetical protein